MKIKVKYKPILILIIILSIVSNVTYATCSLLQSEVPSLSSWAKEDVEKAIEIGLITERIRGNYQKSITREEFGELALELYIFLTGEEVNVDGENPFVDTDNSKIIAANKLGIIQGKGNGRFSPKESITREELAVMLCRTLKIAKPRFDYSQKNEYYFNDDNLVSSWAKEAIDYLYATEIMNGVGGNRFNPKGNTTREEAIVTVKRIYNKVLETERERKTALTVSRSGTSITRSTENSLITQLKNLIPKELGKPYRWGGTGPNSYDCSGLVYYLYKKIGINLPRTSREQATVGTYVAKKDLQFGDLVFFARNGKTINHVGIYVGNGNFVHAPQSGDVVKTSTLLSGYYARSYYTARRVIH